MHYLHFQLAVTPQPRVNGEWINVPSGSQLAVKVEGVILHGSRPGLFRSVSGVVLTLSSQATSRPPNHDGKVRKIMIFFVALTYYLENYFQN